MKKDPSKAKSHKTSQPFEVVKVGSISIPIYTHTNIIPHRHPQTGAILYETLPDGKLKARVKYQSDIYTVALSVADPASSSAALDTTNNLGRHSFQGVEFKPAYDHRCAWPLAKTGRRYGRLYSCAEFPKTLYEGTEPMR